MALIPGHGAPPLNVVITTLRDRLLKNLPAPKPVARLLSVAERPTGLSNRLGSETRGLLGPLALKAGWLDAAVLFEVQRADEATVETAALDLHSALTGERDALRFDGFVRLDGAEFSPAEQDGGTWRKTVSYRVLYEYRYLDTDGSAGLIARIEAHADQEVLNSPSRETTVVTGGTVRWDEVEAPLLRLTGPGPVRGLSVLVFIPGTVPGVGVVLQRTFEGAAEPPTVAPDLPSFLAAGPPPVHVQFKFNTLTDFLNAFDPPADTVDLGDWDVGPDPYELRSLVFTPAVELPATTDRFEVFVAPPATAFDQTAVLYLRAER